MEKKENARVEESLNLEMLLLCVQLGLGKFMNKMELNSYMMDESGKWYLNKKPNMELKKYGRQINIR